MEKDKKIDSKNDTAVENKKSSSVLSYFPFFSKYFFASIIIILVAIVMEQYGCIHNYGCFFYSILYELLKTIGIALFISSIFNFIIGTHAFTNYVKNKIIDVMVTKDFLGKLSIDDRKEMLKTILRPTKEIALIYSGINQYFSKYIEDSMALFKSHFRSGYTIIGVASVDKDSKRVKLELDLNYRIYKVLGKFEKIPLGFEDEGSKLISTTISSNTNEKVYSESELKMETQDKLTDDLLKKDPAIKQGSEINLSEEFKNDDQLDIRRSLIEYGFDHWHLFTYRCSQACDKLSIVITCNDDLEIKKAIPFGNVQNYKVNIEDSKKRISISCNSWLKPGLGFCILIAKSNSSLVPNSR